MNSTVAPTTTARRTRPCPRGSHAAPGLGLADCAPIRKSVARIAMATPSQNGKKPEPGPLAPQYVYDRAAVAA